MRVLGLKVTSTLEEPPLGRRKISEVGEMFSILACCRATSPGVMATVKVMGAGLLFTSLTVLRLVWPTRRAPRLTRLFAGLATSTCKMQINVIQIKPDTSEKNIT